MSIPKNSLIVSLATLAGFLIASSAFAGHTKKDPNNTKASIHTNVQSTGGRQYLSPGALEDGSLATTGSGRQNLKPGPYEGGSLGTSSGARQYLNPGKYEGGSFGTNGTGSGSTCGSGTCGDGSNCHHGCGSNYCHGNYGCYGEMSAPPVFEPLSTVTVNRYVVVPGDTLESVSTKVFGTPDQALPIATLNRLAANVALVPGQTLMLPAISANEVLSPSQAPVATSLPAVVN
jgi:nucleoid-associated protein YgaU